MADLSRLQSAEAVLITDTSNSVAVANAAPSGSDYGLVVRNIVSGTQSVSGTITNVPSGTQAVSGIVTAVPSGTQSVTVTEKISAHNPDTLSFEDGLKVSYWHPDNGRWQLLDMTDDPAGYGFPVIVGNSVNVTGTVVASPSGTQTVAGTVTSVQSGTYAVSGTVTNVPSGTQTVAGTITNVPSGTQTVAGTITNVPSGTQTVAGTVTAVASGTQAVSGTVDTELPTAAALADGASATPTTPTVGAVHLLMNATTVDRQRAVVNGLNSTGTGLAAAGIVAQLDDTSTSTVTENQFAVVRMSTRRALLVEGVASGTAVTVAGTVTATGTVTAVASGTQAVSGTITNVPSGTQAVSGTITNVPSGTQAVSGTITSVQSGTYAVSGTITNVPSGTQTVAGTITNVPSGTQTVKGTTSTTATSPSQTAVTTTASTFLSANANRKRFSVQNTGTTLVKLGLGATPTATAYHVCLAACTANDDGTGGFFLDEMWCGTVVGICSGSGTVVITELT